MSFQAGTYSVSPQDDSKRSEFRQTIQKAMDRIRPAVSSIKNEQPIQVSSEVIVPSITTISTITVEDILGMDQMELDDLRREKAKWKLEKELLWDKMVDLENTNRNLKKDKLELECMVQQVIEQSEKEIQSLENKVNSQHHIPELDIEKEASKISESFASNPACKSSYESIIKKSLLELQENGETMIGTICLIKGYSPPNSPTNYTVIIYIITLESVYQIELQNDYRSEVNKRGETYHYYQFDTPLTIEYVKIMKALGDTSFNMGQHEHPYTDKIYKDLHDKIKAVVCSIPGTEYSNLNGPWKRMKTSKGNPIQYININTMKVSTNPPYLHNPIKHN